MRVQRVGRLLVPGIDLTDLHGCDYGGKVARGAVDLVIQAGIRVPVVRGVAHTVVQVVGRFEIAAGRHFRQDVDIIAQ